MKNKSASGLLACSMLILLLSSAPAAASGFGTYADDVEAVALGGAFTARAQGASAMFYNPAALISDYAFTIRTSVFSRSTDVTVSGVESDNKRVVNGVVAFSATLSDRIAFGVGYFPMIDNLLVWDDSESALLLPFSADFSIRLLRAAVSYKINDQFSIGAGLDYFDASLTLKSDFQWTTANIARFEFGGSDISQSLQGFNDTAFGFSLGVLGQLTEQWTVGAMYRHGAELELTGTAGFPEEHDNLLGTFLIDEPRLGGAVDPRPFLREQLPQSTNATMTIKLPAEFSAGLYYHGDGPFSASADLRWTQWSDMADNTIILDSGKVYSLGGSWDDTFSFHLGGEYGVTERLAVLGGYSFSPSPVSDGPVPLFFPFGDHQDFSIGARFNYLNATQAEKITGHFDLFATLIFSKFSDLDSAELDLALPQFDPPFQIFDRGAPDSFDISTDSFTFLVGLSASFN